MNEGWKTHGTECSDTRVPLIIGNSAFCLQSFIVEKFWDNCCVIISWTWSKLRLSFIALIKMRTGLGLCPPLLLLVLVSCLKSFTNQDQSSYRVLVASSLCADPLLRRCTSVTATSTSACCIAPPQHQLSLATSKHMLIRQDPLPDYMKYSRPVCLFLIKLNDDVI